LSLLELENVSFENDGETILENISVKIEPGDYISIVGPSGSGKSTFLKLCSHLINPTNGKITYRDKKFIDYNPTELRKTITYCFQTPYLFGITVMDNIKFPFTIRKLAFDKNRVDELFSLFHITTDFLSKDVANLSGGEKQRIALIRSLLFKPEILLLDEITSALDEDNTKIVETVIESLNKEGVTVLFVTHDSEQSRKYANRLLTIERGKIKSLEALK